MRKKHFKENSTNERVGKLGYILLHTVLDSDVVSRDNNSLHCAKPALSKSTETNKQSVELIGSLLVGLRVSARLHDTVT